MGNAMCRAPQEFVDWVDSLTHLIEEKTGRRITRSEGMRILMAIHVTNEDKLRQIIDTMSRRRVRRRFVFLSSEGAV